MKTRRQYHKDDHDYQEDGKTEVGRVKFLDKEHGHYVSRVSEESSDDHGNTP